MRLSAATALDEVLAGTSLATIADRHSMEDIVAAVRDAKTALRLGVVRLDDEALRRADERGWSIAQVIGHSLASDEAAHAIARSLVIGRVPTGIDLGYDRPGPAATKAELLREIGASEERLPETRVLAAGGPTFTHRDLGALNARGWILFIGVHDAMHLHQAAGILRGR